MSPPSGASPSIPLVPRLPPPPFATPATRPTYTIFPSHGLRHTHATILLMNGVPVKVVSERLGHASPAFTMGVYQHVLPGMQAEAAELFAEVLRQAAERKRGGASGG